MSPACPVGLAPIIAMLGVGAEVGAARVVTGSATLSPLPGADWTVSGVPGDTGKARRPNYRLSSPDVRLPLVFPRRPITSCLSQLYLATTVVSGHYLGLVCACLDWNFLEFAVGGSTQNQLGLPCSVCPSGKNLVSRVPGLFGFTENAYNSRCGICPLGGNFVPGRMFMQDWPKDHWRVPRFHQMGARSA